MPRLSNDPKTGVPTIDDKPASKEEVRRFGGYYDTTKPPAKGTGDGKRSRGR